VTVAEAGWSADPVPDHSGELGRLPAGTCPDRGLGGVGHVIADAGYDADHLRTFTADDLGATEQNKQNPSRSGTTAIGLALSKERNLVEWFFNQIKRFRRIALRCEKTVASFAGCVALAWAMSRLASMKTPPKACRGSPRPSTGRIARACRFRPA
jgi:transposase